MAKCAKGIQYADFTKGPKAKALPCQHGKARGTGDTITLHSLTPGPAFEVKVSTQHLHSSPARPTDPNTYRHYLVFMAMRSQALLNLPVK